jgi:predicted transcriptional regulator
MAIRVVVILLVCSLAGCSLLYSYRNIDRYIRWSLDDHISWDSNQESQLRARLGMQLAWHRETQLPRYRVWLEALDRTLDEDVEVTQLAEAADQLQAFWEEAATQWKPDIAAQLASLSDSQVQELIESVREEQADLKKEYSDMTPVGLVKKRKKSMRKAAKYWLGALDKKQVALVDEWSHQMLDNTSHWLGNRDRWIDVFEQALQHRHEAGQFTEKIHLLFVVPQEIRSKEFRELSQNNRELTLQLIADLHNSRTEKQREVERKRIAQWLARLERLAKS